MATFAFLGASASSPTTNANVDGDKRTTARITFSLLHKAMCWGGGAAPPPPPPRFPASFTSAVSASMDLGDGGVPGITARKFSRAPVRAEAAASSCAVIGFTLAGLNTITDALTPAGSSPTGEPTKAARPWFAAAATMGVAAFRLALVRQSLMGADGLLLKSKTNTG